MQTSKAAIDRLIADLQNVGGGAKPPKPPLNDGPGRGTYDGMEARVAVLEAHVEHIRSDLGKLASVPKDLGVLTERVSHLPTKGFIVTTTLTALVAIAALSGFVQWILSAQP